MKLAARFVISAAAAAEFPPAKGPELAIVGRSNVGKSSLINAIVGQTIARTSRTPGRTRLVNWFEVDPPKGSRDDAAPRAPFYLVDFPGYGYADVPRAMRDSWRPLIEAYLTKRDALAAAVLLVDIRRAIGEDELDFAAWLRQRDVALVVALTKADKLAKHERPLAATAAKRALELRRDPLVVSIDDAPAIGKLQRTLLTIIDEARR